MGSPTQALSRITRAVTELFDRIVNQELTVRRLNLAAPELRELGETARQLDLFTDPRAEQREEALQQAVLSIRSKYGKNALLKGRDFLEGATARERNGQIGGHRQ